MLHQLKIDQNWTVTAGPQRHLVPDAVEGVVIPASVPGNVHLDLISAGLLEDPYFGRNEHLVQWVGDAEWIYQTTFEVPTSGHDRHELVFEGLDTVAVIVLNDVEVARTFNQHRTYRIDVSDVVVTGVNTLRVTFERVRDYALALRVGLGDRPHNYPEPYNFVRKSAANFGWDWGPNLATVGIWKTVFLESWTGARIAAIRPHVSVAEDGAGVVDLDVEVARSSGGTAAIEVTIGTARQTFTVTGEPTQRFRVEVPDVALWWPRGLGAPTLYDLTVRLLGQDGDELDRWARRVGFRTVEHKTAIDAAGREYTLSINGVDIFVRGANWIPDDCFVGGVHEPRYRKRVQQAIDANMNLLRVWGGGIYEKDEFYDICDETGLLVTQDFLFACGAYPEEEPIRREVEQEARDNITRIMSHPSMVLWNGSNENIWGYFDWGWKDRLADQTWGLGYYLDLLPDLVGELDPTTPYWASSPYSGTMEIHPNHPSYGNQHLWDVWVQLDYLHYSDTEPRFVSEFGFQGPANWATIRTSIADDPLTPDGVELLHHQKAADGNGKLARGMAPHLPEPDGFDEWHYFTQLNQARAVAYGIEYFRSLRPHCMGAIVWQLNDCWPVTSWAAVDGHGRRKPLWYELRRVYADRLLTFQPGPDGELSVVAVNDGPDPWIDELTVSRLSVDGREAARHRVDVRVPPRSTLRVTLPDEVRNPEQPTKEGLIAQAGETRSIRFYREDRDMEFGRARYVVETADTPEGIAMTVTAISLVRDLVIGADRVDPLAEVDDQVVTLLPGEAKTFKISTEARAENSSWAGSFVVRAVNDAAHFGE